MGRSYGGTGSRDADGVGGEAEVLREMAEFDGQRLPWRHELTRLGRWLLRR